MFRDGTLDGKEVAAVDAEKDFRDAGWVLGAVSDHDGFGSVWVRTFWLEWLVSDCRE